MSRPRLRLPWRRTEPESQQDTAPNPETQEDAPAKPEPQEEAATEVLPPSGLWFRFTTRIRAVGYWFGEKLPIAGGAIARAGRAIARLWTERSTSTKRRIGAAVGILALYSVIKFLPVPLVPCEISAAKECAPDDHVSRLASKNSLLYAHLTLDRDSHQYDLASDFAGQFPDLGLLVQQATARLPTPSGNPVDVQKDVLPWAEGDFALEELPGRKRSTQVAFLIGVGDREGAKDFVARIAPAGKRRTARESGLPLTFYPKGGFAAAYVEDQLMVGDAPAVRASLQVAAGEADGLDGVPAGDARDALPDVRFADVFLSRAGVRRFLSPRASGSSQLDTFVDYGATTGFAASATARDDGIELKLVSKLDQKLLKASPTVFAELPEFEPTLVSEAGDRALGYIGVGEIGPTLAQLIEGTGGKGLAASLRKLAKSLRKEAKVDPLKDLLPALGGQAALVAEPTDSVPFASLIVDGVDEDKARTALAKLQGPFLRSLKGSTKGRIPRFEEQDVDGVSVRSVRISGTVNLAYAVFDGKLVVSTDPAGIEQVQAGGGSLAGSGIYERATDDLPDQVSALVFLNLHEVLGLAEQAGLAEDPLYASLSDDISNVESVALAVNGDDDELRSELFLAID